MCKEYRSLMVDVVSGAAEEGDRLRLEDHVRSCRSCASEYALLRADLGLIRPDRSDPGAAFWATYYERLDRRMDRENSGRVSGTTDRPAIPTALSDAWRRIRAIQFGFPTPGLKLTGQLAVAILLIVFGIWMGRRSVAPNRVPPENVAGREDSRALRYAALDARTHDYLDRSRTLLLGLVNFDPSEDDPATLNLPRRQEMASSLIREAGILQDELSTSHRQRLRSLVADLELILLQIANLESDYDIPEIEMVQSGVDRKSILFKIDVEKMRQSDAAESPANTSSKRPAA